MSRTIFSLGINPQMIKHFLAKVRFPMVLEFNSSTTSLASCKKKYLPGLRMDPVEVNSTASTNSFLFLSAV